MTKVQFENILDEPSLRPDGMPDWVCVRSMDRVVPINLHSPFISKELLRKFRADELITFEDDWHLNHGKAVEVNDEKFTQEILVEWTNTVSESHKSFYSKSQNVSYQE
jgi:hypothetical protein